MNYEDKPDYNLIYHLLLKILIKVEVDEIMTNYTLQPIPSILGEFDSFTNYSSNIADLCPDTLRFVPKSSCKSVNVENPEEESKTMDYEEALPDLTNDYYFKEHVLDLCFYSTKITEDWGKFGKIPQKIHLSLETERINKYENLFYQCFIDLYQVNSLLLNFYISFPMFYFQ